MKKLVISYLIGFVMDMLRDMVKKTSNTIDDDIVETLNINMEQIKAEITKRL